MEISLPFSSSSQSQEDSQGNKKKKQRSALDDLKAAKKIYDNASKYSNPVYLIVIIIIVVMIILLGSGSTTGLPGGGDDDSKSGAPSPSGAPSTSIPGLSLVLKAPIEVDNGENLEYTIEVVYDGLNPPLADITIYVLFPTNTTYVEATGAFELNGFELSWPMSQNDKSFTFTIHPDAQDVIISNTAYARVKKFLSTGAGEPPTNDSCGGKYNLAATPIGANFGDPTCDFDELKLYSLLGRLDQPNAEFWYVCALLESSRNPNAYAGHVAVGTPDPAGAWGLFQMGRGLNGPLDHGDVDWNTQTTNAISYSKKMKSFKEYWQCARDLNYDGVSI